MSPLLPVSVVHVGLLNVARRRQKHQQTVNPFASAALVCSRQCDAACCQAASAPLLIPLLTLWLAMRLLGVRRLVCAVATEQLCVSRVAVVYDVFVNAEWGNAVLHMA